VEEKEMINGIARLEALLDKVNDWRKSPVNWFHNVFEFLTILW
jgi:hypothetical protein